MSASRVRSGRSTVLLLVLLAGLAIPASAQDPSADPESAREDAAEEAADTTEAAGEEVPPPPGDVEEFLVVAPPLQEIMDASRMDADELINTLDASELSKFAASDVADALKFVPGVSVVEGQFAIIRGLEDRYNSTLFNGAPVPSPDPDSQSVQLDLFPSDVVSNLVVSKTFSPDLPSNSSGGAINIITHDYPEELEIKLSGGGGAESMAWDRFLRLNDGSPVGVETDWHDILESEYGASIGGRRLIIGRELRFKGVVNREIDYRTAEGFQESREPRLAQTRNFPRPPCPCVVESGDLSLGDLSLSGGRWDLTESERSEQNTGYGGLGIDLDEAGNHKIDGSLFYTTKDEEIVQLKEDGYLPNFDYEQLRAIQEGGGNIDGQLFDGFATANAWIARGVRESPNDDPNRGHVWYANLTESESYQRDRDLLVYQLNGDHTIELLDGLHVSWAANRAKTTQEETSRSARFFAEPDDLTNIPDQVPITASSLGPGTWYANEGVFFSSNDIDEDQDFARIDADYERSLHESVTVEVNGGLWYEKADRDVDSSFLESPRVPGPGGQNFAIPGESLQELGDRLFDELANDGYRDTTNESSREIKAWNVGSKATFFEKVDVLGGLRAESIFIESLNEPFTGETNPIDGTRAVFPSKYLFFDRLDNPARDGISQPPPPGTVFNDELLGIEVPVDPVTGFVDLDDAALASLINGEIDEKKVLPSAGLNYRPIEGLNLRAAWSKTVARPSFREMGYYVSVEPGSDDLIVGNPQLVLSDVQSWDARAEYTWGEFGDLAAISVFYKTIEDPIESIVVRDPASPDAASNALYRTFFNNPNKGTLKGVELETRKNLGFIPYEFARYLSLGGNFTYIDAEVDRTDAELARSAPFFGTAPGDNERFSDLADSRRLFGQPEWIANVDFSFEQPDWGTRVNLIFFAISDVLDAAGSASLNANGNIFAYTLDRYVDSYYQLDLNASQTFHVDLLRGDLTLRAGVKNLTNSARGIIYDPEQTHDEIAERSYKIGRDFSFSLNYTFTF